VAKRKFSSKKLYVLAEAIIKTVSCFSLAFGFIFLIISYVIGDEFGKSTGQAFVGGGWLLLIVFYGGTWLFKYLFPEIKKKKMLGIKKLKAVEKKTSKEVTIDGKKYEGKKGLLS